MRKYMLFLMMILLISCTPVLAGVSIEQTFTDPAFQTLVRQFDTDKDGFLIDTEIANVTEIDCQKNPSIKSLAGIENFTSLKSLNCWACPITILNLSNNKQLEYLDCCETNLTSLDVSNNPNIHQLWAYGNAFTTLDLSYNPYLVKAAGNGVYNNDKNNGSAYSFADEETSSYLVIDKKVTVSLGGGKYITPSSGGSTTTDPTTKPSGGSAPSGSTVKPEDTFDVGEERSFTGNITLKGSFMDGFFPAVSSDKNVATGASARTGNIQYADGVQYFFTVWIKAVGPGTATITLYNNARTVKLWEKTISVRGDVTTGGNSTSGSSSANGFASAQSSAKKATKITASKKTFKAKTKVKKYTVTLKSGKTPVKGAKLTLKVNKKTYKATTNKNGKATFKINKLMKKGIYTATVKYAGNKKYKATSKKVKITVKT